ncbi:MAG: hypothetical protein ACSLEY_04020 [Candidatus Saccharimonadales bacterium]
MKKNDLAMIILIAGLSLVISYFIFSALPIFKDTGGQATVPQATLIEPTIGDISKEVFNEEAINPTVEINISTPDITVDVPKQDNTAQEGQ